MNNYKIIVFGDYRRDLTFYSNDRTQSRIIFKRDFEHFRQHLNF